MKFVLRVILAVASSALSACSLFSSETKIKPAELTVIQPSADWRVLWHGEVGKAKGYVFTPAVVGEAVYAASEDGSIVRYEGGREIWRVSAGERLSAGVGSDGRLVVVGTPKGEVLTFDAETGNARWQTRVSSEVLAAPVVGEGLVVVRTGDAHIVGLAAEDGKRRWNYQQTLPALTLRSSVGVLLGQTVVVAGFPGGKLVALNNQTGASVWEVLAALPKGATELERIADIASLPAVREREICAAAYQGRVACFDIGTGNLLWSRDLSSSAGIDLDEHHLYVSDDRGTVLGFARDSGASLWKQEALFMRRLSRPVALSSRVAVADFQGIVHLLDANDGSFVARTATDGSAIVADPQRLADGLVVQTVDGGIFALGVR